MKAKWKFGVAFLLAATLASPAFAATVCGVVQNSQGQPVSGLQVIAKNPSGQVLGQGTTGAKGEYLIQGIQPGTVDLFLDTSNTSYKHGSGVLNLTGASSNVSWEVSDAANALAAQNGTCVDPPAGMSNLEKGSIAVLGIGGAGAIGVTAWGLSSNLSDNNGPPPPHIISPGE